VTADAHEAQHKQRGEAQVAVVPHEEIEQVLLLRIVSRVDALGPVIVRVLVPVAAIVVERPRRLVEPRRNRHHRASHQVSGVQRRSDRISIAGSRAAGSAARDLQNSATENRDGQQSGWQLKPVAQASEQPGQHEPVPFTTPVAPDPHHGVDGEQGTVGRDRWLFSGTA